MARATEIEWTWLRMPDGSYAKGQTWNPIRGCTEISPGCTNCYAASHAARFSEAGLPFAGLARFDANGRAHWTGKIALAENHLFDPLRSRSPGKVFVNSMSDLFHDGVGWDYIDRIFAVMALATHKTFIALTKRPAAALEWAQEGGTVERVRRAIETIQDEFPRRLEIPPWRWPLPNYWHGFSAENDANLLARAGDALAFPARYHVLSAEPLLGPLRSLQRYLGLNLRIPIDWVIVGGESEAAGHHARPMDLCWARAIREECKGTRTAFFMKQWGNWLPGEPYSASLYRMQNGKLLSAEDLEAHRVYYWDYCKCISIHVANKKDAGRALDNRIWDDSPA